MKAKEIIKLISDAKSKMIIFVSFFVVCSFVYSFFIATPYYESIARVYPVKDDVSFNRSLADASPILRNFGAGFNSSYKKIDFYIPELIKSDEILGKILENEFYISESKQKVKLIDFWKMEEPNSDKTFYQAKNKLSKLIDVKSKDISSQFTISIKTEDPLLSADIMYFMINQVEEYIVTEKNKLYINKGLIVDSLRTDYKSKFDNKQKDLLDFIDNPENAKSLGRKDERTIQELDNKKREINFDEQAYSFLTTDYIQANIESKSKNAIHRLDVPETRILDEDFKSDTYGSIILNPNYRINYEASSPKKMLTVMLTFITSCFTFIYYLVLRKKFA